MDYYLPYPSYQYYLFLSQLLSPSPSSLMIHTSSVLSFLLLFSSDVHLHVLHICRMGSISCRTHIQLVFRPENSKIIVITQTYLMYSIIHLHLRSMINYQLISLSFILFHFFFFLFLLLLSDLFLSLSLFIYSWHLLLILLLHLLMLQIHSSDLFYLCLYPYPYLFLSICASWCANHIR